MDISGRHEPDFEHVILRVDNRTEELTAVYLSRHAGGQWIPRRRFAAEGLQLLDGTNPRVFAAKSTHAFYPRAGMHLYESRPIHWQYEDLFGIIIDAIDFTDYGLPFRSSAHYNIVSSEFPEYPVVKPGWLQFEGNLGPTEAQKEYVHIHDITPLSLHLFLALQFPVVEAVLLTDLISYPYEAIVSAGKGPANEDQHPSWNFRWW